MTQTGVKIRQTDSRVNGKLYPRWIVDMGVVDGERLRRSFGTEAEAAAFANGEVKRRKKIGEDAARLSKANLRDAVEALRALGGRATLATSARYYLEHTTPPGGGERTVAAVIDEYMAEARRDNLRPRTIKDMGNRLARFVRDYGTRPISSITMRDADAWRRGLTGEDGQALSPVSRRNYCRVVHGLFAYAQDAEVARDNPFSTKGRTRRGRGMTADEKMPEILTVDECTRLLNAAAKNVPEMLPTLAIQMFCGLRTAEAQALNWSNIDFEGRIITIPPGIAKKRRVRHIDMSNNLLEWLIPYRRAAGPVSFHVESEYRSKLDRVRETAKLDRWPINGLRHSFASYHLAYHNDQNKTALLLGHRDTKVLFDHYRNLVKPADAARYWELRPITDTAVIPLQPFKAG